MPVSLGVRQYSARLEMFRQLAGQLAPNATDAHCCWVDIGGERVAEVGQLGAAFKRAAAAAVAAKAAGTAGGNPAAQLQEADHVYNPSAVGTPGAVVAILHASPGTPCWLELHAALKKAAADTGSSSADSPTVIYAHRPVLSTACQVYFCTHLPFLRCPTSCSVGHVVSWCPTAPLPVSWCPHGRLLAHPGVSLRTQEFPCARLHTAPG